MKPWLTASLRRAPADPSTYSDAYRAELDRRRAVFGLPQVFGRELGQLGEDAKRVRGQARGFMRLLGPLLDRMVQSSVRRDYARLRDILEEPPES